MNTNKEELERHRKLMIDVINAASKKSNKELIKDSSSDIGSPTQVIAYAELISRAQTELLDIANRSGSLHVASVSTLSQAIQILSEDATMSSTSSINGMGEVILPNGEETGSGDIIVGSKKKKKKKIRSIEQIIDDANEEIELTEEQKILIIKLLLDDTEISKLDEGILGSILGGLGGLTFGKSIGKLLADTLGIRENSPLYSVLTSRLVATAIGAALGKNSSI